MSAKSTLLAINGGTKAIEQTFSVYNTMGPEEVEAASEVVKSGVLSDFVGAPGKNFLGGYNVKAFEHEFKNRFEIKNADLADGIDYFKSLNFTTISKPTLSPAFGGASVVFLWGKDGGLIELLGYIK